MNWGNRLRRRKNCIIKGEEESGFFQSMSFIFPLFFCPCRSLFLSCSLSLPLSYLTFPNVWMWLLNERVREIKLSKAFSWNESLELNWMSVLQLAFFGHNRRITQALIWLHALSHFSAVNLKCILTPVAIRHVAIIFRQKVIFCQHIHMQQTCTLFFFLIMWQN